MRLIAATLLLTAHAFGAIAFIASGEGLDSSGSTAAHKIDSTGATLLIVTVARSSAATGISGPVDFTDACPSGPCNTFATAVSKTGTNSVTTVYYSVNPANTGTGHYFVFTATSGALYITGAAYSGSALSNLVDQLNSNATSGTGSIQPGSITPACTNELVITSVAGETLSGSTPSLAGATVREEQAGLSSPTRTPGGFGDAIQTTATAINPTWSFTTNGKDAAIVSFKAATSICASTTPVVHKVAQ